MSQLDAIPTGSSVPPTEVHIVDAAQASGWIDFREIWRYRELIWIFAVRDVKVKYRQTIVGVAWTVLQPLALMFAFGVLKQVLVTDVSKTGVPDSVMTFSGLLLYQLFAGILNASTLCMVDNRQIVTKVYFPRIALPLSACLRPLLDFSIGAVVFVLILIVNQVLPSLGILLSPLVILMTVIVGLAFGLWLSALNAQYRDFGYIVPFLLNLGLLISPVGFEASEVPDRWRLLYFVNPMASLLSLFRASLFGTALPAAHELLISFVAGVTILVSGAWFFNRVDRYMADRI
jgi:lipopolysaccharide transport system permease protein